MQASRVETVVVLYAFHSIVPKWSQVTSKA